MNNLPVPGNEQERLVALKNYRVLDTITEIEYDRLTQLAALICDTPVSMITLIDDQRQWIKSKVGIALEEMPRNLTFCQYAIMGTIMFEVEDASKDERFATNPVVTAPGGARFYAGWPLIDSEGYALGTLCVLDSKPRKLTEVQTKALKLLADEVIDLITNNRKNKELEHFEKLFNLSEDIICIAGVDGFYKRINPFFTSVLGWGQEEMAGISYFGLVHPDDLRSMRKEIDKLFKGASTISFTCRFRTKSGDYKVLSWVANLEREEQNIFAIARDVTREKSKELLLKNSENKLRAFFEHSQGLMCTHDMQGNFITVNASGADLIGYTVAEVAGKTLFDITPTAHHDSIRKYIEDININGTATGLMTTLHRDGSPRIWMYNNVVEEDTSGERYVIGNSIDITERYRLEKDLIKTKETLEQINKVAYVGGWELNLVKNKLYWSDITKAIHGVDKDYNPDLETAINFYKEGESRNRIAKAVEAGIAEGKNWNLELPMINAQGRELWVRSVGEAKMENGKCVSVFGTFQDIDERKKVELEVVRSRKQLNDVLQAATDVFIIATDARGLITVFNKGAENMLGYTAEEMVGKETPGKIHDHDQLVAHARELSIRYNTKIEGVRAFIYEAEIQGIHRKEWISIRKDGSRFMASIVATAIRDDKDDIIGYLGIGTDVSDRKKAEQLLLTEQSRLKAFVEHAPAAVAMFDKDIRYVAASNRWMEEFHIKGRQILGESHYDVVANVSDEWRSRHQRSLKGEVVKNDEDVWRPAGWDHDQYLKWEVRPWYLPDGAIGGIMMFTQDITEACRQRHELRVAKQHAEQANVAKSEFLANMSHEIRTPLNGVIGFTDLVLKTDLNETQQQYLSIVNHSANALLSIINDILDFSKIEAGKLELDIEKCDVYELASEAADIITYQAQKKGLEVLLNISPELPRFIWADSVRLKQVMVNLLGNAVKFTGKGEIELKVEAMSDLNKDQVTYRFMVRDTGIGIKPEMQNKIFEAFAQEDPSTTKKYGGTGLGLTISNKLLALMGSKLKLKSTAGQGSCFYFDITLKSETGEPLKWENIEKIKKVLIVDDNSNNRLILKQMLLLKDISSDEAENGFEALQKMASGEKYDVIFMDYHMPYMDGLETIKKIRENFYDTAEKQPISLLHSSSDDEAIIKACHELKVGQRLVKPIKMQDMFNSLSRLLSTDFKKENQQKDTAPTVDNNKEVSILLAEDNEVNILLARTIINRIAPRAKVNVALNGLEAVKHCATNKPDLVLMDIQMPEMNGYEATKLIREQEKDSHIPIVALTAGNVKGERERCIAAGMDDFMPKPFVEETLIELFNRWIWVSKPIPEVAVLPKVNHAKKHFDADVIREKFGVDDETLKEILKATIVQLNESLDDLKHSIGSRDLKSINGVGHKLYGTAVSTSLSELAIIAARIERLDQ